MRTSVALTVCLLASACSKSIPAPEPGSAPQANSLPSNGNLAETYNVERELTAEELRKIKFPAPESSAANATLPSAKQGTARTYAVEGELTTEDLRQIELLVAGLTDDPILHIKVLRAGRVEVNTGVVRGPLAGHGRYFDFEKRDGQWVQINTDTIRWWMS